MAEQVSNTRRSWASVWLVLPVLLGLTGCQTLDRIGEDLGQAVAEINDAAFGPTSPIELPPAEQPDYQPGQVFVYAPDRVRQVHSVSNGEIQWKNRDQLLYRTSEHFFLPRTFQAGRNRTIRREFSGDPGALWPLAVGKEVEVVERRRTENKETQTVDETSRRWQCSVDDARVSQTPAGLFDSYRVTCRSYREGFRSVRGLSPVQIVRWDYAPQIGHYVRRESFVPSSGRRHTTELRAALPAALASPERIDALVRRLANDS